MLERLRLALLRECTARLTAENIPRLTRETFRRAFLERVCTPLSATPAGPRPCIYTFILYRVSKSIKRFLQVCECVISRLAGAEPEGESV
jgi:hypothetical protein